MTFAAVVLAAGSARRFGGDKLAAPLGGEPLLHHAVRAARAAPVDRVIVVARPGLNTGEWAGPPSVVPLAIESEALSDSLKAGLDAAGNTDGVFVFLGDMPLVPHGLASRLASVLGDAFAAIPRHGGKAGHPVLLAARALPDIAGITGDEGAGKLLRARTDVAWVDCDDSGILADVDRPDDLARLQPPED